MNITDKLKRPLRDLRISVTDKCNFRCQYCMPAEIFDQYYTFLKKEKLLTFEEIVRFTRLMTNLGVEKIRLTGGEPLIRQELEKLVEQLYRLPGVKDIALTTNGSLLAPKVMGLKKAGLDRITISLDALDPSVFNAMNGGVGNIQDVLDGIDAADQAGMKIKINMVVQKGVNDQEILPMARYFHRKGHTLRFIEFMDVGNINGWNMEQVVPSKDIVRLIQEELPIEPVEPNYYGEVAKRYRYADNGAEMGLISSVTQPFCSSCTRGRLSADGMFYTCLFASKGQDIRSLLRSDKTDEEMQEYMRNLWRYRDDRYSEQRTDLMNDPNRKKIEMNRMGG